MNKRDTKAFTLVELLVVIAIIALLMAILLPSFSKARLQAKIVVVHSELAQIALALDAYEMVNNSVPNTWFDCEQIAHMYRLPPELINGGYITSGGKRGKTKYSDIEDKFFPGHTYKYIAPGTMLFDNNFSPSYIQYLCMSANYPDDSDSDSDLQRYKDKKKSPVKWVLFSLGPNYNTKEVGNRDWNGFPLNSGFPVMQSYWYSNHSKSGVLTRVKLQNDRHIGTFQK